MTSVAIMPAAAFEVASSATVLDAIKVIDSGGYGVALVLNENQVIRFTITDGDVRRAILRGVPLTAPVADLEIVKRDNASAAPLVAPHIATSEQMIEIMVDHGVRHLPLVDEIGRPRSLAILAAEITPVLDVEAVVMAGGFGTRLRPLTDKIPKPMLPVGGRPLIETQLLQLARSGVRSVNISTHYLAEVIRDYIGDGSRYRMAVRYHHEAEPRGTAGGLLEILPQATRPVLVMNGDILTNIDFQAFVKYHEAEGALLTVAVSTYDYQVPYGVVECEGPRVLGITEKPSFMYFINAGIYILSPEALRYIPSNQRYDMTALIGELLARGQPVAAFPMRETWLDIGKYDDYNRAHALYEAMNAPGV